MQITFSHILLGSLLAGAPLAIIEFLSRQYEFRPEISRKAVHVLSALAVVFMTNFCSLTEIAWIGVIFLVILTISHLAKIWHSLYRIDRQSWGEVWFAAGVIVASLLAPSTSSFILAVLILGLSDTLAGLAGTKYGRRKLPYSSKSYVGSIVFLLSAYAIGSLVWNAFLKPELLVLALIATFAEAISGGGVDNLTIPAVVVVFSNIAF